MNRTQGTKYTCPHLQQQQTVYLDQVVDEWHLLPLSLQETASIEAYAQRNVTSSFLFKNSVKKINQGVIYNQSRKKFLLHQKGPTKLCEHVLHGRIKTFMESSHPEMTVVSVKTRQPNSAWVDCVLSVQNAGKQKWHPIQIGKGHEKREITTFCIK